MSSKNKKAPKGLRVRISDLLKKVRRRDQTIKTMEENNESLTRRLLEVNARSSMTERLLRLSHEEKNLTRYLEKALDVIFTTPFLQNNGAGAVFLIEEENRLTLKARRGLLNIGNRCARVPFRHCLCGKVAKKNAASTETVLTGTHNNHAHPINQGNRQLGVLFIQTPTSTEVSQLLKEACDVISLVVQSKDLTSRLERDALYDNLTGIPNRRLLMDRLKQMSKRRRGSLLSILYIDLNRFKKVNDIFGHAAGDKLLCQASKRIERCLRQSDTVARLGGDEFVVVLPETLPEGAIDVAKKIINSVEKPFHLGESKKALISTSIGIATYPHHSDCLDELLQLADSEMYEAKKKAHLTGRGAYSVCQNAS